MRPALRGLLVVGLAGCRPPPGATDTRESPATVDAGARPGLADATSAPPDLPFADAVTNASAHTDDAVGQLRELVRFACEQHDVDDFVDLLGTVATRTRDEVHVRPRGPHLRAVRLSLDPGVSTVEVELTQAQWGRDLEAAFGRAHVAPIGHPFEDETRVFEFDVDWGGPFALRLHTDPIATRVPFARAGVSSMTIYRYRR